MSIRVRLIFGLAATLAALYMTGATGESQQPEVRIVGVWTQYYESGRSGKWTQHGAFRVFMKDDKLQMASEDQTKAPEGAIKSRGLFNVGFNGETWTFDSDWGNGRIGSFKLRRVNDDVYEGYSYLNDQRRDHNIWVRASK